MSRPVRDFVFMKGTAFNPENQELELSSKIVAGLERVSQAFKVLLWDKAKELGLSPIQIQLLIFCCYHKSDLNNVSALAKEFNVTKPTISDAVKVLDKKGLIEKDYSSSDSRSYSVTLSDNGKEIVAKTENFAHPIWTILKNINEEELTTFFSTLSSLLFQLNKKGILSVQRTCYACRFLNKNASGQYCKLLEKQLNDSEIRLDCQEYEPAV